MEQVVDAVTAVRAHHGASVGARDGLAVGVSACACIFPLRNIQKEEGDVHGPAEVAEERAGLAELDRSVEGLARGTHDPLRVLVNATNGVRFIQIRMEAYMASQLPVRGRETPRALTILVQRHICMVVGHV